MPVNKKGRQSSKVVDAPPREGEAPGSACRILDNLKREWG